MLLTIDPSLERPVQLSLVTVTADDIRDFAQALGNLNPLYLDRRLQDVCYERRWANRREYP